MTPQEQREYKKLTNIEIIESINISVSNIVDEIKYIKKTHEIKSSSDSALDYAQNIQDMINILYERKNKKQFN